MAETKKTKPAKKSEHPTFAVMIAAAIASLNERKGSSKQAIEKYVCTNYKVGSNYNFHLKRALKRGVEIGALVQTKGVGASGSFKLAKPEPVKKPAAKNPAAKKTLAKQTAAKEAPAKKVVKYTSAKEPVEKEKPKKKPANKPANVVNKAPPKKKVAKK